MKNNNLQQPEKEFYQKLYKDKTILIKLSGAEIADTNFEQTVKDIKALIADQIKIILVFGGGKQIDEAWIKNGHTDARPKKDGVGISTKEVMQDGVIPAFAEIKGKLKKYFQSIPKTKFLETNEIQGQIIDPESESLTGEPTEIVLHSDKQLQVLGFVGEDETGEKLNINADEIVSNLVKDNNNQIIEVIFATQTGGIQDKNYEIVPTISDKKIPCILEGKHPEIKVKDGMYKKVIEAQKTLEHVDKVAITNLSGIYDEITKLSGAGTLLFNLEKTNILPLNNPEIFDLQYTQKTKSEDWLPRTETEIEELKQNHFVLSLNGSPLGGYSLVDKELEIFNQKTEVLSFECWWADTEKNGIGLHLLEHVIQEAEEKGKTLATFTKRNLNKFSKNLGFRKHGKIKSSSGATLWLK